MNTTLVYLATNLLITLVGMFIGVVVSLILYSDKDSNDNK